MLAKLFLIFTITSLVELTLLIWLGQLMGLGPTIVLVCVTALVGALLGKQQGLRAWRRIREDLEHARLPADSILDGLAVLIASAFLLTPGVLTDAAALMLLFPVTRRPIKKVVRRRLDRWMEKPSSGLFGMFGSLDGGFAGEEDVYGDRHGSYAGHGGDEVVLDVDLVDPHHGQPAERGKEQGARERRVLEVEIE